MCKRDVPNRTRSTPLRESFPHVQKGRPKLHIGTVFLVRMPFPMCDLERPFCTSETHSSGARLPVRQPPLRVDCLSRSFGPLFHSGHLMVPGVALCELVYPPLLA